jgi:hypothetical protein
MAGRPRATLSCKGWDLTKPAAKVTSGSVIPTMAAVLAGYVMVLADLPDSPCRPLSGF